MKEKTAERRLDLLRLEGNGLQPREIVKELSVKYGITKRQIYSDFQTRKIWQPILEEAEEIVLKVRNRHEQLYRKALISYMQAKSDRTKISALNLLRQINVDVAELTGAKSQKTAEPEESVIKWEDPEDCKKEY